VKISALYSQLNPAAPADAIAHLGTRLRPLLRRARELGAFINFDMESYVLKNTTLDLFKTILTETEFKDWPNAGIVIQAYLRDSIALWHGRPDQTRAGENGLSRSRILSNWRITAGHGLSR